MPPSAHGDYFNCSSKIDPAFATCCGWTLIRRCWTHWPPCDCRRDWERRDRVRRLSGEARDEGDAPLQARLHLQALLRKAQQPLVSDVPRLHPVLLHHRTRRRRQRWRRRRRRRGAAWSILAATAGQPEPSVRDGDGAARKLKANDGKVRTRKQEKKLWKKLNCSNYYLKAFIAKKKHFKWLAVLLLG